jgi:carbon monoxide dehydrogenase subunit G
VQIRESFVVDVPAAAVWTFFEQVERVARCVPGVQRVESVAPDVWKLTVTQKVGFISATFEMTTRVDAREPLRSLELSSVGRSVKGAVGDLRSKDRVEFEPTDGGTRVTLYSELAVGGMLGALGHKVIASKSKEITAKFAEALRGELQTGRSRT